jgi:hypothetical protein
MATLRTTAILKTDLSGSAARFRAFSRRPQRDGIAFVTGQVRRELAGPPGTRACSGSRWRWATVSLTSRSIAWTRAQAPDAAFLSGDHKCEAMRAR